MLCARTSSTSISKSPSRRRFDPNNNNFILQGTESSSPAPRRVTESQRHLLSHRNHLRQLDDDDNDETISAFDDPLLNPSRHYKRFAKQLHNIKHQNQRQQSKGKTSPNSKNSSSKGQERSSKESPQENSNEQKEKDAVNEEDAKNAKNKNVDNSNKNKDNNHHNVKRERFSRQNTSHLRYITEESPRDQQERVVDIFASTKDRLSYFPNQQTVSTVRKITSMQESLASGDKMIVEMGKRIGLYSAAQRQQQQQQEKEQMRNKNNISKVTNKNNVGSKKSAILNDEDQGRSHLLFINEGAVVVAAADTRVKSGRPLSSSTATATRRPRSATTTTTTTKRKSGKNKMPQTFIATSPNRFQQHLHHHSIVSASTNTTQNCSLFSVPFSDESRVPMSSIITRPFSHLQAQQFSPFVSPSRREILESIKTAEWLSNQDDIQERKATTTMMATTMMIPSHSRQQTPPQASSGRSSPTNNNSNNNNNNAQLHLQPSSSSATTSLSRVGSRSTNNFNKSPFVPTTTTTTLTTASQNHAPNHARRQSLAGSATGSNSQQQQRQQRQRQNNHHPSHHSGCGASSASGQTPTTTGHDGDNNTADHHHHHGVGAAQGPKNKLHNVVSQQLAARYLQQFRSLLGTSGLTETRWFDGSLSVDTRDAYMREWKCCALMRRLILENFDDLREWAEIWETTTRNNNNNNNKKGNQGGDDDDEGGDDWILM